MTHGCCLVVRYQPAYLHTYRALMSMAAYVRCLCAVSRLQNRHSAVREMIEARFEWYLPTYFHIPKPVNEAGRQTGSKRSFPLPVARA